MNRMFVPMVLVGAVGAGVGAVIERLIAASAYIEDDTDVGAARPGGAHTATATGKQQCHVHRKQRRGDDDEFPHSRGKNRTQSGVRQGGGAPFYR